MIDGCLVSHILVTIFSSDFGLRRLYGGVCGSRYDWARELDTNPTLSNLGAVQAIFPLFSPSPLRQLSVDMQLVGWRANIPYVL